MARYKDRSKKGCTSCLRRKIKCDEQHPTCWQCVKAEIKCLWDLASRIHVQKSRRRCNTTKYSTISSETSALNAADRVGSDTQDMNVTAQLQLPSSDYSLLDVPTSAESGVALTFTANDDFRRPMDTLHPWHIDQHGLNRDSSLEIPSSLLSHVYPPSLRCANSIPLSHRHRLYLEYFPTSSLVKVLGKAYTWSNFRYICQNKASEEAIVMYAVMALSASEMSQSLGLPQSHDEGQFYYNLALQRIADAVSSLTCESNNIEAVLSALFLIITYEWRFLSFISHIQSHTQYLFACLDLFFQPAEHGSNVSIDLTTYPSFTPFCAQILLWILYVESSCIRGNLSFELMDYFHMHGGESQLQTLFRSARHSYLSIHGEQYPAEQHQDDLENYRPLQLVHEDYLFRYRIWRLFQRYHRGEPVQSELEILWREINIIGKAYSDLIELRKTPPRNVIGCRAFITLCEGLAGYYCNILLIHRLFRYRVVPVESHDQALCELFDICYTIHKWYPVDPTLGFAWYLLIAGLEGKDWIHQDWAYDRLKDLGERWNTCKWAGDMLRLVHDPSDVGWLNDNDHIFKLIQPIP